MSINQKEFLRLIPRLVEHPKIRAAIGEQYGDEAEMLLGALRAGTPLGDDVDEDKLGELALNAFHSEARTIVSLSWDGVAPGGSGAVWVSECMGVYVTTSSDYSPEGPFESLSDALLSGCSFVATLEPEVHSDVLTEEELLGIAEGVVDSQNEGSVWVNGVEYLAGGGGLRRRNDEENGG
jgi:hypothetical protein